MVNSKIMFKKTISIGDASSSMLSLLLKWFGSLSISINELQGINQKFVSIKIVSVRDILPTNVHNYNNRNITDDY